MPSTIIDSAIFGDIFSAEAMRNVWSDENRTQKYLDIAMVADHERSTGPWEIEWVVLPESFCLTSGALKQARFILSGLEVDAKRMREVLDMTHGLVVSEAVMMGLGPHLGREHAHDLVYDICRDAIREGRPLLDLLAENKEITKHLGRPELAKLCDPAHYLGQSGAMVDRVLAGLDAS